MQKEDLTMYLENEATTITALLNEIEYGENDAKDFISALRQVGSRMRYLAKMLASDTSLVIE